MTKIMLVGLLIAIGSGCTTTLTKSKGVMVEKDAQDKQVKKIETESATQTIRTSKELTLKHLDI